MDNQKVMVITGSSKGIGRGAAEFFVKEGYIVFGCSRGASTLELGGYYHEKVDVTDDKQVREWFRRIKKHSEQIDVVVCFAGIAPANFALNMMPHQLMEDVIKINVGGTYTVCKEASKVMIPKRLGTIITVSSMAVGLHLEGTSAYAASKSAIVEMTKILAKELVSVGITCNVLAPSMYMTESVEELGQNIIESALDKLTLKRKLTIEEICNVISFYASPKSRCITGQVIHMGLVN